VIALALALALTPALTIDDFDWNRGRAQVQVFAPAPTRVRIHLRPCAGTIAVDGRRVRARRTVTLPLPAGERTLTLRRGRCRVKRLDVDWTPAPTTTWQWQLSGPLDTTVAAELYDVDLFETPASTVAGLQARGTRVICYFSAGSTTTGGPLAGRRLEGWPDERWLDIRRLDVLGPLIERRLDLCARKGFDGVEPDNVDGYANRSGFPLRAADQLRFNRFLAREAHERGLSIGLKNDLDQVRALEPHFDWALDEQCFEYRECHRLRPFTEAGKAVFVAEYSLAPEAFCPAARAAGFMAMQKPLELGAQRTPCW
jgi:hypothetical protein